MGVLTEEMRRVVLEQRLGFHATVRPDGTPNLSPKGTTTVWDDDHLLFADIRSPDTIANLHANPAIEVNVVDPIVRKGWRFRGRAQLHADGETYDRALTLLEKRGYDARSSRIHTIALIRVEEAPQYLGHHPLQQLSYTGIYALALLQVVTGFYMYGLTDPAGFFYGAFGWVGTLMGGAQIVRFVHHVATWAWLIFLPIHVYLAVRADVLHRESTVSSIVSGNRYVRADVECVDDGAPYGGARRG